MSDNIPVKDSDLDELKKEMRSAQWIDWVEKNQKSLIGAAAAVVVVLMAVGLWLENEQSQRATAATIYQQAMNEGDSAKKLALLQSINRDFSSSSYSALALMQLASVDSKNAELHLNALMAHGKAMDEWIWQARLDLAEIKLAEGDAAAAKSLLDQQVGGQYLQLRYYLMAQASGDEAEKQDYLQKAMDAPSSTDAELLRKIESQINKKAS
ncbi:Putative negative regulator of RcsB-dependent stress response [Mariprofundus ferrinatatus]|uniref:Negative regulator of RcsB-dependent stress response n=1 Tax=Mariprofundus ferrinatatus TaxID=1921087 RepID=A0A2K8L3I4_9PROT|nr:tetratricopeptide repeat protein [Mariprofundus ferrinatatus]ATX81813.1 Putative negative regulator of RcsB-dependent stress response [Mariprofundus ferrinatatus]